MSFCPQWLSWRHGAIACTLLCSGAAAAASPAVTGSQPVAISADYLQIVLEPKDTDATKLESLVAFCRHMGKAMSPGGAPLGFGAFVNFGCYLRDSLVAGASGHGPWRMRLSSDAVTAEAAMDFDFSGLSVPGEILAKLPKPTFDLAKASTPVADVTVAPGQNRDERLAQILAATLLVQMPFLALVHTPTLPFVAFTDEEAGWSSRIPQRLVLYRLKIDPWTACWAAHVEGYATFEEDNHWKLDDAAAQALARGPLFAREDKRSFSLADYLARLTDFGSVMTTLGELAKGYSATLYYGFPLVPDAALLPKTRLVNMRGEARRGPLKGLRGHFDYVNPVTDRVDGKRYEYGWERIAASWAFEREVGFIIERASIAPKFGIWNMQLALPPVEAGGETREFVFSHKESAGFDLDVAWGLGPMTLRLWHGRDITLSLFGKDKAGASSQRYGFDSSWAARAMKLGGFELRPIVAFFFMYEGMFVTGNEQAPSSTARPSGLSSSGKADEIFFDLFYAGIGAGVSW